MKKSLVIMALGALALFGACSSNDSNGDDSTKAADDVLAYGGLEFIISAARADASASAKFSLLSEPLDLMDGATIDSAAIVMEDVRFIMNAGNEYRWRHGEENGSGGQHWDGEYMGGDSGMGGDASASGRLNALADGERSQDGADDDDDDANGNQGGDAGQSDASGSGDGDGEGDAVCDQLEEENAKSKLPGPYYVDLIAGQSYPAMDTTPIPAGTYNGILFALGNVTAENSGTFGLDVSSPIVGNSLIVAGTFTAADAAVIPFRILFADDDSSTYRFELIDGLVIDPDAINPVVMEFDVAGWFSNQDIRDLYQDGGCEADLTCTVDDDGTYLFTLADSELRNSFRERFRNSAACGKDGDGNGRLDSSEQSAIEPAAQ